MNFGFESKSTSTTNYSDSSKNANAEGGSIVALDGSSVVSAGDNSLIMGEGAIYKEDITGSILDRFLAGQDIQAALTNSLALNAVSGATQNADNITKASQEIVANNAALAGRSMDTALAFAENAKPASATFADAIPILAVAAAIAVIGYALVRKKS
jgi:hypothetical protein